ncbi:MAG: alpha/beta hydrolase, partial [Chthoniobacterales bacterium]
MRVKNFQARWQRRRLPWWVVAVFIPILWAQAASARQRQQRPDFPDVDVQRDLVYKTINGLSLRLDIYSPKSISHPLPVILWIHGGGWSRGRKEQKPPINLMAQGYIVVSIDYRLSQEAPFPAQIEDCKAAVRWLR